MTNEEISQQLQEITLILRAVAEQSQLHDRQIANNAEQIAALDRQIAQNTADIALLVKVVADQGEYFRGWMTWSNGNNHYQQDLKMTQSHTHVRIIDQGTVEIRLTCRLATAPASLDTLSKVLRLEAEKVCPEELAVSDSVHGLALGSVEALISRISTNNA